MALPFVLVRSFSVEKNGDIFEVEWIARNTTTNIDATGVVSNFLLPTEGLSYVSSVAPAGNGVYNPALARWTVGTVFRNTFKRIKIKYRVDDISLLNFTIKQTLTLNESQSVLDDDKRTVFVHKVGDDACDPENFITPTLELTDDDIYELVYIGENDTVKCPCCTKSYNKVAGSEVNVTVISISSDGWAKIRRKNPKNNSTFQYTASCTDCTDGEDYTSFMTATATINRLFDGVKEWEAIVKLKAGANDPVIDYISTNELGGTVVFTRESPGMYLATLAGAFTWMHTHVYVTPEANSGFDIDASRISDNQIRITHDIIDVVADPGADVTFTMLIRVKVPEIPLSPTPSVTPSVTASITPSISITKSVTPSVSVTPTVTASTSVTPSITASITVSYSITPSISISSSVTPSVSVTPSITPSISITASVTASITVSYSITPSISITASITPSISISPSATASVTMSVTPSTSPV